ncbi:MAG TPA: sodium:calcium antiporter [Candidatus Paceibacterota bacterium]|nr:sodium:calcium antiporter [Candidatus Paceibacterota bacterium]
MIHFLFLIIAAVLIYLSCEWFVNAVEWLGKRIKIGPMAVGTILAAFGTALPESIITLVAVLGNGAGQKDIGVGSALGGPLVLATIAYGITGVAFYFYLRRHKAMHFLQEKLQYTETGMHKYFGDTKKLVHDQKWFLSIFVFKVALGLVAFSIKPWLGILFFLAYVMYFWNEIRSGHGGEHGDLDPLLMQKHKKSPDNWAIAVQTLVTLLVIFFASELFVHQLEAIGPMIGLSASLTALLFSPVATELPEIMNTIIWVRQGKTSLALANISGSMMIQATIPSGLGILFTSWMFTAPLLLSGIITMIAIGYLLALMHWKRLTPITLGCAVLFYALFAALLPFVSSFSL